MWGEGEEGEGCARAARGGARARAHLAKDVAKVGGVVEPVLQVRRLRLIARAQLGRVGRVGHEAARRIVPHVFEAVVAARVAEKGREPASARHRLRRRGVARVVRGAKDGDRARVGVVRGVARGRHDERVLNGHGRAERLEDCWERASGRGSGRSTRRARVHTRHGERRGRAWSARPARLRARRRRERAQQRHGSGRCMVTRTVSDPVCDEEVVAICKEARARHERALRLGERERGVSERARDERRWERTRRHASGGRGGARARRQGAALVQRGAPLLSPSSVKRAPS